MPTPTAVRTQPRARRLPLTEASLYRQGYRVRPYGTGKHCWFVVTNPEGVERLVKPLVASCSCPASGPCRHLNGLMGLLRETWIALGDERAQDAFEIGTAWDSLRYELGLLPAWRDGK